MRVGVGLIVEIGEEIDGVLAVLPLGKTARAPVGEVLLCNGPAGKVIVDDLPGLGKGVKPVEDGFIILGGFEAPIELFADGMRETGDFSSSHNESM